MQYKSIRFSHSAFLTAAFFFALSSASLGDRIQIPGEGGSVTIDSASSASAIGQSFTASQPKYSHIGLGIEDVNPGSGNFEVSYELRSGSGVFGPLLRAETLIVPYAGFNDYLYMNTSDIDYVVGNQYTLLATTFFNSRWAVTHPAQIDPYPGGEGFQVGFPTDSDKAFSAVPEAATAVLAVLGGTLLSLVARLRRG